MPSELPLSTHLPTLEGWIAELAVGLWFIVSVMGFEPTRVDPTRFETLYLNHSATSPLNSIDYFTNLFRNTMAMNSLLTFEENNINIGCNKTTNRYEF